MSLDGDMYRLGRAAALFVGLLLVLPGTAAAEITHVWQHRLLRAPPPGSQRRSQSECAMSLGGGVCAQWARGILARSDSGNTHVM